MKQKLPITGKVRDAATWSSVALCGVGVSRLPRPEEGGGRHHRLMARVDYGAACSRLGIEEGVGSRRLKLSKTFENKTATNFRHQDLFTSAFGLV